MKRFPFVRVYDFDVILRETLWNLLTHSMAEVSVVVIYTSYRVCKSFFAILFVQKEFFGDLIVFHLIVDSKTF